MTTPPHEVQRTSMRSDSLRPRLLDLDEFEEGQEEVKWPSAASVTRAPPPPVLPAKASQPKKKSVRIDAPTQLAEKEEVALLRRTRPAAPSRFAASAAERASQDDGVTAGRFTMPLNGDEFTAPASTAEEVEGEEEEDEDEEPLGAPITAGAPLVGGVRERISAASSSNVRRAAGESRFAASRRLKQDAAGSLTTLAGSPSVEQLSAPKQQEEAWLDEDGNAMSAFRIARFKAAGKGPPSRGSPAPESASPKAMLAIAREQDAATASMLKEADAENARKLQSMKSDEVQRELEELKAHFGEEMLQLLRGRLHGGGSGKAESATSAISLSKAAQAPPRPASKAAAHPMNLDQAQPEDDTPEVIRARYFPNEPSAPASLQWMMNATSDSNSKAGAAASATPTSRTSNIRFDFSGHVVRPGEARLNEGLYHHGEDADEAGYTAEELLHLARSTVPAQRVSALQTLQRVMSAFPEGQSDNATSATLDAAHVRQRAALTAAWLLPDRQRSVRHASIAALRAALASSARGPHPIAGVEAPHKAAPAFNETFEVAVKRDVIEGLLRARVVPALKQVIAADEGEDTSTAIDVLALIVAHSSAAAAAAASETDLVRIITVHGLRNQHGPAAVRTLELLELLVLAGPTSALEVFKQTSQVMLRYFALPPWADATSSESQSAWKHFELALRVLASLARYGLAAELLTHAASVFTHLLSWYSSRCIDNAQAMAPHEAQVASAALQLYEAWTACAANAHETTPKHAVEWNAVRLGAQTALEALLALNERSTTEELCAAGAAASLLATWFEVGRRAGSDTTLATWEKFDATRVDAFAVRLADALQGLLGSLGTTSEPFWKQAQSNVVQLGSLARAGSSFVRLASSTRFAIAPSLVVAARHLLQSNVWRQLDSVAALAVGSAGPRKELSTFCALTLLQDQHATRKLSLLAKLQPGDEEVALELVHALVLPNHARILRPFFAESLRSPLRADGLPVYAPALSSKGAIKRTSSLFLPLPPSSKPLEEEPEESQDGSAQQQENTTSPPKHDVDPVSGARLWRSPSSGLPLRCDWMLQALDDLLHSADCAALNRPNSLPSDWDANERDVVAATLQLSVAMISEGLESDADVEALPQAAQVLMGCIKVFLLEGGSPTDPRASGKATGRDLFRDASIAASLSSLVTLASRLATHPHSRDTALTLEGASTADEVPFYQTYTDVVGLYDGISYGDARFAQALLTPIAQHYARDYRHLLWADYSHLLPTIHTSLREAPVDTREGVLAYFSPREQDEEMRMRYAGALVRGTIKPDTNPLLWSIALHHSVAALWSKEKQAAALAKIFFAAPAGNASLDMLRRSALRYDARATEHEPLRHADDAGVASEVIKQRIDALREWLGESIANAALALVELQE